MASKSNIQTLTRELTDAAIETFHGPHGTKIKKPVVDVTPDSMTSASASNDRALASLVKKADTGNKRPFMVIPDDKGNPVLKIEGDKDGKQAARLLKDPQWYDVLQKSLDANEGKPHVRIGDIGTGPMIPDDMNLITKVSKAEDQRSMFASPDFDAWLKRDADSKLGQVGKDLLGMPFGRGYTGELADRLRLTSDMDSTKWNKSNTPSEGAVMNMLKRTGANLAEWAPSIPTLATAGVTAGSVASTFSTKEKDAEISSRDKKVTHASLENEPLLEHIGAEDRNMSDPNAFTGFTAKHKFHDVVSMEAWDSVLDSFGKNSTPEAVFLTDPQEVFDKFRTAYSDKVKDMGGKTFKRNSKGEEIHDDKGDPVPESLTDPAAIFSKISASGGAISPHWLGQKEGEFGFTAKDGKRYRPVLLNTGSSHQNALKASKDELDKGSGAAKSKPTDKVALLGDELKSRRSNKPVQWVFFEVGDKKGLDAIYRDKEGNFATPEFVRTREGSEAK